MKTLLFSVAVLTAFSFSASAQSSQAPPIKPILSSVGAGTSVAGDFTLRYSTTVIIKSHDKSYRLDSTQLVKAIKKEWISNFAIKRDTIYSNPKQFNFRNTTIITLDDADHPEAFTTLKHALTAI